MSEEKKVNVCGDCELIGTNNLCGNPESGSFRGRVLATTAACDKYQEREASPPTFTDSASLIDEMEGGHDE